MQIKTSKLFKITLIIILMAATLCVSSYWYFHSFISYTPFSQKESREILSNPYCGFYHINGYTPGEHSAEYAAFWADDIVTHADMPFVLLEINLKNFKNKDLDDNSLNEISAIFDTYKKAHFSLIVRFLYDWDGNAPLTEPRSIKRIMSHMSSLSPVISKNTDTIYLIQGVFTGDCGEMHNTRFGDSSHITRLMNHLYSLTPPEIFLSVRTPAQLRTIIKSFDPVNESESYKGSLSSRLGLFNDGMLGNSFDCGTYDDSPLLHNNDYTQKGTRKEELEYQNKLCLYVPNGGEAVLDNPLNDIENAIPALKTMHVSYLNEDHDTNVIAKWKSSVYEGNDIFHGFSGYNYIKAHLGYRFVLKNSTFDKDTHTLKCVISNTGFAPCYRPLKLKLVIRDMTTLETADISTDFDTRSLLPDKDGIVSFPLDIRKIFNTYTMSGKTEYTLSLSLYDEATKQPVYFANTVKNPDCSIPCGRLAY